MPFFSKNFNNLDFETSVNIAIGGVNKYHSKRRYNNTNAHVIMNILSKDQ